MEDKNKYKKYPEGHFVGIYMGMSMAIFTGGFVPIAILTNIYGLIGVGPAIGVAVGIAIGSSVEKKYKDEGRIIPRDSESTSKVKKIAIVGIILGIILLFGLIIIFILK